MVTKVFVPNLYEGFILRVFVATHRETKKNRLVDDFMAHYSEEYAEGGYYFVLTGPKEKFFAKIVREKIKEVKKSPVKSFGKITGSDKTKKPSRKPDRG